MGKELLSYMKRLRGAPHKGHKHHQEEDEEVPRELKKDGVRLHVNFRAAFLYCDIQNPKVLKT